MNIKLSDNIRVFRKARSLTQQQLAEALGVTAGAVYKWEAKLSTPDINILIELADLFDTSVDVLLGYEMKDNKQATLIARLREHLHNKDMQGLVEAEKALIRYPNNFNVVHQSAILYHMFGLMHHDKKLLCRSIELMERSILLIEHNSEPEISELSIYRDIACIYSLMGEDDRAVEILTRHNPCGIFDAAIGLSLGSGCNRQDEALPYLSMALLNNTISLVQIFTGYFNVFFKKRDYSSAITILKMALNFFADLKEQEKSSFLDKICVQFYVCLAMAEIELRDIDVARKSLHTAKMIAEKFDLLPNYEANSIRFVFTSEQKTVFDDLGTTAMDCIQNMMEDGGSETLLALWEEIKRAGKK